MTEQETIDNLNNMVGKHVYCLYNKPNFNLKKLTEPLITGLGKLQKFDRAYEYVVYFNDCSSIAFTIEHVLQSKINITLAKECLHYKEEVSVLSGPLSVED